MGILGVGIVLGGIETVVFLAIGIRNHRMGCLGVDIRKTIAVGTHVGNQTFLPVADINTFIEALCHGHRALGREAKLGGSLLLQGRSNKRTERSGVLGRFLDGRDRKVTLASVEYLHGIFFCMKFCLLSFDFG